jgi:hypothetical protein
VESDHGSKIFPVNHTPTPAMSYYFSAKFYETGTDDFGFLKQIGELI